MLTRRICITIKSFISWQSIPLYSQPWYVIQWCYSEEKSDPSDSYSILLFLYSISLFIHFYMNILLIMVIELSQVHSARSIWNHKYDFRPISKAQGSITRLYYIHFEITQIQDLVSSKILLMQYWAGLKLNSFIFWGKKQEFWKQRLQIFPMILFVFHFPPIRLVTLNKPRNLIGCFVFSVASSMAGKMMRFKAKNGVICE